MRPSPAAVPWPIRAYSLHPASQRQRVGRHVLRDHRAGADVGAIADAHGRDQCSVAADEDASADGGGILVQAVVIAGDGAGADVPVSSPIVASLPR